MGQTDSTRITRIALIAGAVFTIGVGVYLALAVGWVGWLVVAFGLLDLAFMPFLVGRIGARAKEAERTAIATGDAGETPAAEPAEASDPSYNPYARDD